MSKPFFITTSIPYVNAAPHVGFAMEAVQADIIARYQRMLGRTVYFLSGTDDNALKNVLKAEEAGKPVAEYVAENGALFKGLLEKLNISNDDFIHTSSDLRHALGAQKLWNSFKPEDITKKTYKGLYCVGCEEFKTEKDLVNGECPEHPGKKLEEIEEENYFFKLGNYQQKIVDLIESNILKINPVSRKNEVLSFVNGGLQDLSISRSRKRAHDWGVPVPGDDGQVMYVWVDALSNYITSLNYASNGAAFQTMWNGDGDRVHAIGKGITRFHAVYWPAFLLSAGLALPTELFVHGYITSAGQKMSKSLGNVIDPLEFVHEYGADAFRYFIAREVSVTEDSDFTHERFREAYNGSLVNGLGNVVARVLKLAETHVSAPVAVVQTPLPQEYTDALDAYDINAAAHVVWQKIQELDQHINQTAPFKVVKVDPVQGRELIEGQVRELYTIARLLTPLLPDTSDIIQTAILENKKPENLFPRK